jgi:hypothetical protein
VFEAFPVCSPLEVVEVHSNATVQGVSRNPRARDSACSSSSASAAAQKLSLLPPRRPLGCHPSNSPHILLRFIMLRTTLRQCSRQLQSCSAKARLSTIAASPARTNAIATFRRPLAVAQRRNYALTAEETDKGVVRGRTPQVVKISRA